MTARPPKTWPTYRYLHSFPYAFIPKRRGAALVQEDEMAKTIIQFYRIILLVSILAAGIFPFTNRNEIIPVTAEGVDTQASATTNLVSLSDFSKAVVDGKELIRGVYVEDTMALRVMQQPNGNNGFVSSVAGVATQFRMAERFGTIGLLAHNFAAGSNYSQVDLQDVITVVYGDGTMKKFVVTSIVKFQALSPNSATSSFVDLASGDTLTATKLFEKIYKGDPHLVLQTCIAAENEVSWGRLFVIAQPLEDIRYH